MSENGFQCGSCGEWHDELPLVFGPDAPAYWYGMSPSERKTRFKLDSDLAILDGEHFFVRGRLEIPIHEREECFAWLVWSTLRQEDFHRTVELWKRPGREAEPPYFGWLSTQLPYQPATINLKLNVHTRPVGERPFIEVEPTSHPLAVEQRTGISMARVQELAGLALHGSTGRGA